MTYQYKVFLLGLKLIQLKEDKGRFMFTKEVKASHQQNNGKLRQIVADRCAADFNTCIETAFYVGRKMVGVLGIQLLLELNADLSLQA